MKHLKQVSKHLRKCLKNVENHCKYMQHQDEALANIRMRHLKHMCNMHVYVTFRSAFATSR
jgi:hypothetical protein